MGAGGGLGAEVELGGVALGAAGDDEAAGQAVEGEGLAELVQQLGDLVARR